MRALSKATIYGLRALIYVASKNNRNEYVSIGEISDELGISFHFLTKTFQVLNQNGILVSLRGPKGGILLARPIDQIYLIELVHILEGDDFFDKCLLGLPGCGEEAPCPVHNFWKNVKGSLQTEFNKTSLAMLIRGVNSGKMRI
jgi:Rrf2 family iron-sulfur cluster assembly transcriptional regulator